MARVIAGKAGVGRGPVRSSRVRALWACVGLAPLAPLALLAGGCVEQTLTVDSNPPGAVVYLNDQEVGRTPMTTDYKWHGWYEVALRKEGYETLKTKSPVIAPLWNWMPFDLFAELLPVRLKDEQHLHYDLQAVSDRVIDPHRLVRQGERLRTELETGVNPPRTPRTRPARETPTTKTSKPAGKAQTTAPVSLPPQRDDTEDVRPVTAPDSD